MKFKRLLSALLVTAVLLTCGAPVFAASSSFDDITNPTDALNADVLRFMGVVGGKGGNRFDPAGNLTRAEFCTMLIGVMGKQDQVSGQLNRTIFIDVPSTHWARGYVNLAASTSVSGDGQGGRLISGVGNGKFEPDRAITFGEAATILVRLLGYTDAQVGNIWPHDYVSKAREIGLSAGVSADAFGAITRAQAAQMFVNLLSCKTSSKTPYYNTLGTAQKDTILLSLNTTADDGTPGAVMTTQGRYLPAGSTLPSSLLGQKGVQVINGDGLIVAFIPDSSSSVTVTLSGRAEAGSLKAADGTRYTISAGTRVYTAGEEGTTTYAAVYDKLTSGSQVTLYTSNGKVTGLYYGGGASASGDAVIVTGTATSAMFHQLTGGASGYQILKNRQSISLSDIQPYDVATYDPVNNTLLISDLRFTAVYENVSPSVRAPERVNVLGIEGGLEVLPCAVDSLSQFRLGDTFTLLLTADGKVAGAVAPSSQARSTAVGLVENGCVTISLPSGGTLVCTGSFSSSALAGQLVTVSSYYRGDLSVSRLPVKGAPGDFDLKNMTLGQYTVTAGVSVYERVGANGPVVPVSLGSIELSSIPADKIATYHLNTSGMVDILVLDNVTGNAFTYGILKEGSVTSGDGGLSATNRTVRVWNSAGESAELVTGYYFTDGGFGGVAAGPEGKALSVISLTEIQNVSSGDFFTAEGAMYVSAGGRVYPVSGQVQCYNSYSRTWFSGEDALDQARTFAERITVYADPIAGMVRIVAVDVQ